MPRAVCSFCCRPSREKLATAYWAWFNADGNRRAWKLRYCLADAQEHLAKLSAISSVTEETSEIFACVSCGVSTVEDSDPIYCTLYLPKRERADLDFQLCSACAARWRIPIVDNGELQADRNGSTGKVSGLDPWSAIGILPNDAA